MAKFPPPLNMPGVDVQVVQQALNAVKQLLVQRESEFESFKNQLVTDLTRLREEVPGLRDRLLLSADGYEVMEPEPEGE